MKRWGRVTLDGLFMFKGQRLMHQWERVNCFKLREQKIGWGRPKNNISSNSKNDMSIKEVTESMTLDKIKWRKIIYVTDPN